LQALWTPLGLLTMYGKKKKKKKKGYCVTQLWEVVLELCVAQNGLLDNSLVTNLQKTNKQKLAGNAAKVTTMLRKFLRFTQNFFAENYNKI
jgi:hypothetical protein